MLALTLQQVAPSLNVEDFRAMLHLMPDQFSNALMGARLEGAVLATGLIAAWEFLTSLNWERF